MEAGSGEFVADTPDRFQPGQGNPPSAPTTEDGEGTSNPGIGALMRSILAKMDEQERKTSERFAALSEVCAAMQSQAGSPDAAVAEEATPANPTQGSDELAELRGKIKEVSTRMHRATSSAPDVDRMLEQSQNTPFTARVRNVVIPKDTKINYAHFKGDSDPTHHLTSFEIAIHRCNLTPAQSDAGKCQLFTELLSGDALGWFSNLPANSIDNFKQLSLAFMKQYSILAIPGATADLWSTVQRIDEPLRGFIERFKKVAFQVNAPNKVWLSALRSALLFKCRFREDLTLNQYVTLEDALHRATRYVEMEEEQNVLSQKYMPPKQQIPKNKDEYVEPRQHYDKSYVADARKRPPSSYMLAEADPESGPSSPLPQPPPPLPPQVEQDHSLYCELHEVTGHSTASCRHLQSLLLNKYLKGDVEVTLRQYKSGGQRGRGAGQRGRGRGRGNIQSRLGPQGDDRPAPVNGNNARPGQNGQDAARIANQEDEQLPPPPARRRIYMIHSKDYERDDYPDPQAETGLVNVIMGGLTACRDSVRSIKDYVKAGAAAVWPTKPAPYIPPIMFTSEDALGVSFPHNDPLVIELQIGDSEVTRILIDTGSSVNVIFREVLDKMGVTDSEIKPSVRPLTGFDGNYLMSAGTIKLPIYVDGHVSLHKFMVVEKPAVYNVILGTPWLHDMQAVPSTYHHCVKMPTPKGICVIRGNQVDARNCFVIECKLRKAIDL
ncbi:uncharacterized protein LOC111831878 [Capsella rubella]|uniref:uncharacterized protein LOC111831878 n=1 Tax=Capsella rubella TaxID=81985 RepID=UPI000CD547DA|nr:uncharacterized protein LOC111831878 [Capsella rubella]